MKILIGGAAILAATMTFGVVVFMIPLLNKDALKQRDEMKRSVFEN